MKNLIDNIENGKFSDAKEELSDMVKQNIADRIADIQEELGLVGEGKKPIKEEDEEDENKDKKKDKKDNEEEEEEEETDESMALRIATKKRTDKTVKK